MRATDVVGTKILGAIEGDQHVLAGPTEGGQATGLLQVCQHGVEYRMQQRRVSRVQHIADMAVPRDFAHPEQGFAVRSSLAFPQVFLVCQERWALHEEHRERRHADIGDRIGHVYPPPLVGECHTGLP
jgi:hypothetical protein